MVEVNRLDTEGDEMISTILGGAYIQQVIARIPELSGIGYIERIEVEGWNSSNMTFPDLHAVEIEIEVPLAFLHVTILHGVGCRETIRLKVMDDKEQANAWDFSRILADPYREPTKQYWLKNLT